MGAAFALAYAIAPGTIRVVTGDLWPFACSISLTCISIDPSRVSAFMASGRSDAAKIFEPPSNGSSNALGRIRPT